MVCPIFVEFFNLKQLKGDVVRVYNLFTSVCILKANSALLEEATSTAGTTLVSSHTSFSNYARHFPLRAMSKFIGPTVTIPGP